MELDTRCIFCLTDASASKSVEHVVPESLGNRSYVLPAGIVCDRCNGYFAVKVEKPLLEADFFTSLRFHQAVPSKRGKIPTTEGVHAETGIAVTAYKTAAGRPGILIHPDQIDSFFDAISRTGAGKILFSDPQEPPSYLIERFMAKCGLEMVAQRVYMQPDWRAQMVLRSEFNPIRRFARFGEGKRWPVHIRRIYSADASIVSLTGSREQVLFEYDLLYSDRSELYAVLAYFGIEFTINLVGPELDGYVDWLRRHSGVSPLYTHQGRQQL